MNRWATALRLVGVGFFIAGAIVLGIGAGLWLDKMLDTKPVLVIVGLIMGIVVAVYGVYQMLLPLISNRQDKRGK